MLAYQILAQSYRALSTHDQGKFRTEIGVITLTESHNRELKRIEKASTRSQNVAYRAGADLAMPKQKPDGKRAPAKGLPPPPKPDSCRTCDLELSAIGKDLASFPPGKDRNDLLDVLRELRRAKPKTDEAGRNLLEQIGDLRQKVPVTESGKPSKRGRLGEKIPPPSPNGDGLVKTQ